MAGSAVPITTFDASKQSGGHELCVSIWQVPGGGVDSNDGTEHDGVHVQHMQARSYGTPCQCLCTVQRIHSSTPSPASAARWATSRVQWQARPLSTLASLCRTASLGQQRDMPNTHSIIFRCDTT